MSKIKMFVVEDDFLYASRLAAYLDQMGYQLAGSATNAAEALNMIAATQPDLLLVDIHLKGAKDGIEMVEYLNQKNPIPVIFITAFGDKETIERAKETAPYAYIVKPYGKETLQAAIELAIYRFSRTTDFIAVKSRREDSPRWEDRLIRNALFVKKDGNLIKIKLSDIIYVEVKGRLCLLGVGNDIFEVRITLQKLEEKLPKDRFLRIHRSFIVSKEAIEQVNPSKNEVTVGHQVIPIGRAYREAFFNSLDTLSD